MLRVDHEVGGVDIVAFDDPLEELGLVHDSFLHEVNDLVLHRDEVLHPVVQLHLQLVFELAFLAQEVGVLRWLFELLVVGREHVKLINVRPGVEAVAQRVLSADSHVFTPAEQVNLPDLALQSFPVQRMRHPRETHT